MKTITIDELKTLLDDGDQIKLIDVLSEESFRTAHIPGSLNIAVDNPSFERKVAEAAGSRDRRIVVYCASSDCNASRNAAQKLEAAGFSQAFAYEGCIRGWKEAGFALEGQAG